MAVEKDYEYEDLPIELEDEFGNVESYLHVDSLEYKGETYCFFRKADVEPENEDEEEYVIFRLVGEGDDQHFETLEDDQLMDEVFAEFCQQNAQYEDYEDALDLDGGKN